MRSLGPRTAVLAAHAGETIVVAKGGRQSGVLAAQAELEALTLLSVDPALRAFPCKLVW